MPETTTPPIPTPPETDPIGSEASPTPFSAEETREGDAPLSVVPHPAPGSTMQPVRIRSGRYGELEEHELVRLLDSIEDERARARMRESIYLSIFVWMIVAGVIFFGPKYLWHAPEVILPGDALKKQELVRLDAPVLHHAPVLPPRIDNRTLEHLRATEPPRPVAARPTPAPAPAPSPAPATPPPTAAPPTPPPPTAAPNVPTPTRSAPPPLADAPTPRPSSRPSFAQPNASAGDAIQSAIQNAARNRGAGGSIDVPSRGGRSGPLQGGMEVLSNTGDVNINPYLARIKRMIEEQWYPLIPEEAQPPLSKSGITVIRFTINADGSMTVSPHIDDSTHDEALNRAAWGSIVGVGQFPPLPKGMPSPNLELRFAFFVNRQPDVK